MVNVGDQLAVSPSGLLIPPSFEAQFADSAVRYEPLLREHLHMTSEALLLRLAVDSANPCRCAKKTDAFIQAGLVNPRNLLFARERVIRVREVAEKTLDNLDALQTAFAEVHRDHPFHEPPDFVAAMRSLIDSAAFKSTLELD